MNVSEAKKSCEEEGVIYPHGYGFCRDVYCARCADGTLELHPEIGSITDLSLVW